MRDLKNIDRIYQESLKDFEVYPPNKAWNAIEKRLEATPKKRRFPFWIRVASIASLILLFFSIGTIYIIPENNFTKNFLPNLISDDTIEENDAVKLPVESPVASDEEQGKTIPLIELTIDEAPIEGAVVAVNLGKKKSTTEESPAAIEDQSVSNSLRADALSIGSVEKDKDLIRKKELTESKFTLATIFAPIYFDSFGDGSGVGEQFGDNSVSGKSSYSYGVKFAYKLSDKLSLQSGVNLISLGYKTNNVYITPGVAVVSFSDLSSSPYLSKSQAGSGSKSDEIFGAGDGGSLNQVFGYVEIPVELKYNVTEGKLGVNLVGGFSTLLLNKDEVFIHTNDFTQSLGSSNNLRSINFSGNIGLDVDYSIRKNLFINISPMFKMQTNTFSKNSGSFQPFYLGVYTGLNYKF